MRCGAGSLLSQRVDWSGSGITSSCWLKWWTLLRGCRGMEVEMRALDWRMLIDGIDNWDIGLFLVMNRHRVGIEPHGWHTCIGEAFGCTISVCWLIDGIVME